ncbi:MauE/DoxX family redox-associated membrane protein [Pokkaliibacter sp. CJK22405]|uniref:MauE/DoxX family redox-associated membrane protein n=1 Tax=Pokkaliibacter sp. CJK22405 TaxID=3384615 RepID=UPI003984663B
MTTRVKNLRTTDRPQPMLSKDSMLTAGKVPSQHSNTRQPEQSLFAVVAVIALVAVAATAKQASYDGHWQSLTWLHDFTGLMLLLMALFKLLNHKGFVENFQHFDLLARHVPLYAYLYPLLEIVLATALLAHLYPVESYLALVLLMSLSALGVSDALIRGLDMSCPNMGNLLGVPLNLVTLVEYAVMALLGLAMLCLYLPDHPLLG